MPGTTPSRSSALRLIQGDAPVERTDQVVSRHPGQRVTDKTDRTSIGLCATGRRQERREQDARARERLDDAGAASTSSVSQSWGCRTAG